MEDIKEQKKLVKPSDLKQLGNAKVKGLKNIKDNW